MGGKVHNNYLMGLIFSTSWRVALKKFKFHMEDSILLVQNSKNPDCHKEFFFLGSTLQLVENIKPIRKLLCTFSSCSVLGIYMIYNIYKFQEK